MNLHEILGPDGVDLRLGVQSDAQAIQSLVHRLVETGRLDARHESDAILALLKRESARGGTQLGNSIAVPHAKVPYVKDFVGALGVVSHGIPFGGADPVKVVVLLLSPEWDPEGHLRVMSEIARLAMDSAFARRIVSARTSQEVLALFGAGEGAGPVP